MRVELHQALVEREVETETMSSLLGRAAAGRGQLLVISGPVSCGKTALLEVLADQAASADAAILAATCSPAERDRPFAVMRQLLQTCPAGIAERVLPALPPTRPVPGSAPPPVAPEPDPGILESISSAVLELARSRPVVIQVDDADVADEASVQALLHLQRRLRFARVLVAVTERTPTPSVGSTIRAGIARQATTTHLQLAPLSVTGVEQLLAARIDPKTAAWLAPVHRAVSGGNPALLHALIDDHWAGVGSGADPVRAGEDVVGTEYGHAVLACLQRFDSRVLELARGVALLDDAASDAVLSDLVGLGPEVVDTARSTLEQGGLFDGPSFRHAAGRRAVLDGIPAADRPGWHLRIARVLHHGGAEPGAIARHLTEANRTEGEWGVGVLRLAARADLEAHRIDVGVRRLELAARCTVDDDDRAEILLTLLQVQWSRDAAAAARYLGPLRAAMAARRLGYDQILRLAAFMVWYGHGDEVGDLFTGPESEPVSGSTAAGGASTRSRLALVTSAGPSTPIARATSLFDRVRTGASQREVAEVAETLLGRPTEGGPALDILVMALASLIYTDQNDRAARWCDRLLADEAVRRAPTCAAVLESVRGEATLRLGDLKDAADRAEAAYDRLTPQAWGLAIALPLATRISAATAMGDHHQAARLLRRPVPDAMFHTQMGLHYCHARGHHHLAVDRPELALADFRQCGDVMTRWDLDLPGAVPWRVGAAEALLAMGRRDEARTAVDEHLDLPGGDGPRARGSALRVMSGTHAPSRRLELLTEAVDLLDDTGTDRFELARALMDLSKVHQELGDTDRARALARRAGQMAKGCEAEPPPREVDQYVDAVAAPQGTVTPLPVLRSTRDLDPADGAVAVDELSEAERRVAVLASLGHSNRDISRKLYITVSTVEQHLTRVYRKLGVTRRTDLPASLQREPFAAEA